MDAIRTWLDDLAASAMRLAEAAVAWLPELLAALALVLLGLLVAWLVRGAVHRFGIGINGLLDRILRRPGLEGVRLSPGALRIVGTVLYWVVLMVFVAEAARVARLDAVASWLREIVEFLPRLAAGGLIVLAGYVVSTLVRDVVTAKVPAGHGGQEEFAAFVAQAATFLLAVVIGLEQVGIDVTLVMIVIGIVLGGAFTSLAVAFGLGARPLVSNLIAAHDLRQHYAAGQRVVLGGVRGEILQITATSVLVETAEGRAVVPARVFHEEATLLEVPRA